MWDDVYQHTGPNLHQIAKTDDIGFRMSERNVKIQCTLKIVKNSFDGQKKIFGWHFQVLSTN